jgi:DnaJ-class molecular chaperone
VSNDPYAILGVERTATTDDIRAAFRKLARKLHPDLNPGDRTAEEKFKKASAAHDILGDPEKRARFDRGEIDASGNERPPQQEGPREYRRWSAQPGAERYADDSAYADIADADDVLADLLGRGFRRSAGGEGIRLRGGNMRARLAVPFLDAVLGSTQRIVLPDGATVDVTVPPGTDEGDVLRLAGKGAPGLNGGPPGDLLISITVTPHARFRREGDDIVFDLPISLPESVLGAKIEVEAPGGPVRLSVPPASNSGTTLRLRGRGVPRADGTRGDALARLVVMLPNAPDQALKDFVAGWQQGKNHNPRTGTAGGTS